MARPGDQWYLPISWPGWGEEERLGKAKPSAPMQVSDHDQSTTPLLFGPRGEPLLVRRSRPIGFKPPGAK